MTAGPFVSGKGKKKEFTQQLGQNRWEPVELLALVSSSQQARLIDCDVLSRVGSVSLGLRAAPTGSPDRNKKPSRNSSREKKKQQKSAERICL